MPIETIVDYPFGKSASDPSMIVDKISNQIFLFYNYMDLENQLVFYLHVITVINNGKTGNKPQDITSQNNFKCWEKILNYYLRSRNTNKFRSFNAYFE